MTRIEDEWCCSNCGTSLGRHDMWFEGDICGKCYEELNLTDEEKLLLESYINKKRQEIRRDNGLNYISGSFVIIKFVACDCDSILLNLKFGYADDTGSSVTNEKIELFRDELTYLK